MEDTINKKINVRVTEHESRSFNPCWNGKAVIITCSVCVSVALGIQHAIRMRRVSPSMACPLVQYFPHYLIHGMILERHVTEFKMCVWIFCTAFD
jgi:hypothetical protein